MGQRWPGIVGIVIACGCAAGTEDELGFGAMSLSPAGEDDSEPREDEDDSEASTGDDLPADTKGSSPADDDDAPSDTDGATDGDGSDDGSSSGAEPPPPPADDGDEPMPPPPVAGDPLWAPCGDNTQCDSGKCVVAIDGQTQQPIAGYCSDTCNVANLDCSPPATGTAPVTCIAVQDGQSLCALDCTFGQTCPFGMQCLQVGMSAWACF